MRAFGLFCRSAVSGAALGAAPDMTIIPPLARGLNPSFQGRFSPEGGREVFLLDAAAFETS
jgi:hypothetical protein